jgi:hypothetical protein
MLLTLQHRLVPLVALGLALLSACEDEDGPLKCQRMNPIGGNPVGMWERMDFCLEPDPDEVLFDACPSIKPAYQGTHVLGGTFELRADGTYRDQSVSSQSARVEVPLRCVPQVSSCASLATALKTAIESPDATGAATNTAIIFCRGSDPCSCVLEVETKGDKKGTYKIDGAKYLLDDDAGEFSIIGNELRIQSPARPSGAFTGRFLRL